MMSKIAGLLKRHWFFCLFVVIYLSALAYKVVFMAKPFFDWDESLYIQSGNEMFSKNYFLFPVWQGKIWFDKPPLIPFVYALIAKIFFFVSPEISTRLFSTFIVFLIFILIYNLYRKVLKNNFLATLVVFLTAVTPVFLQRSQIINLDIFLLLGWLGYLVFFDRFWISLFFLFIAVFSKSLIGFYPPFIMLCYYSYLWVTKEINFLKFKKYFIRISLHTVILLSWFLIMLVKYGDIFWKMHIVESHFRRVTSSIEFHFGERLFYINLVRDQFGIFFYLAIVGLIILLIQFIRKKINSRLLLYSLYLFPWFVFLNATKTKIFWYAFAIVPQFAFLSLYPLTLLKKNKLFFYIPVFLGFIFIFYQPFFRQSFFTTFYSQYDSVYSLATTAKKNCDRLDILMDPKTRKDFDTLDQLGLLITTTKWWGNHPSILYYFGKETNFVFSKRDFVGKIGELGKNSRFCIAVDSEDSDIDLGRFDLIQKFDSTMLLGEKEN